MNLEEKAIEIRGKQYILVKDRVLEFNDIYKNGSIRTEILSAFDSDTYVIKAIVVPDVSNPDRVFIDYSQAKIGDGYINKTSALENACTSAVGRALAMMGIGIIDSIASADEINKAKHAEFKDEFFDDSKTKEKNPFEIALDKIENWINEKKLTRQDFNNTIFAVSKDKKDFLELTNDQAKIVYERCKIISENNKGV
jgi:hypothetical protein